MIGRLAGTLIHRFKDHVMLDVGGVGYMVFCSERTLMELPPAGESAIVYTELVTREDLMQLYGFTSLIELEWHRLLVTVQGVGAKASVSILGALGADGVSRAVALGDWAAIKSAPGVGPKIAQRVANELREKAADLMARAGDAELEEPPPESGGAGEKPAGKIRRAAAQGEAMSALVNLGYGQSDAASAVASAAESMPEAETEELIKAALKLLAPKGQ